MRLWAILSVFLFMSGLLFGSNNNQLSSKKTEQLERMFEQDQAADDSAHCKNAGRYMAYVSTPLLYGTFLPLYFASLFYDARSFSRRIQSDDNENYTLVPKSKVVKKVETSFWTTVGIGGCATLGTVVTKVAIPELDTRIAIAGSTTTCAATHAFLTKSLLFLSSNNE